MPAQAVFLAMGFVGPERGALLEQLGVEFPTSWSLNSTNIVAQKYFRGTLGTDERESSLRQVIDRVTDTITNWGVEGGYFTDSNEAEAFRSELKFILVTQRAAFNSPVWFNIGVKGVPQQASACFILSVDDTMDSILNWYREEGLIFKGGSGSGVNLSRIRSSKELLSSGGTASGPVSFMRGADASAGTSSFTAGLPSAPVLPAKPFGLPSGSYNVTVSGRVTLNDAPLQNVKIETCIDGKQVTTDAEGRFSIPVPLNGISSIKRTSTGSSFVS